MPQFLVRFTVPLELSVTVDEEDEEAATDVAWELANEYLETVSGDHRSVVAAGSLDGVGADEVEPA